VSYELRVRCTVLLRSAASTRRVKTRARKSRRAWRHAHLWTHGRDVSVSYARGPTKNTAAARFVYGVVALGFPPTVTIGGCSERRRHRSPVAPYRQRPAGRSAATRTAVAEDRPSRQKPSARTPYPNGDQNANRCGRARTWNLYLRNNINIARICHYTAAAVVRMHARNATIISSRPSRIPRGLQCRRRP